MIHAPELLQYSDADKKIVFEYYNVSETQFEEMVEQLLEWAHKKTLPVEHITKNMVRSALLACKMSMEKAKLSMQAYFTTKTVYSDFYQRLLPNTKEYEKSKLLAKTAVLPKLSPDLHRITVFRINDLHAEAPDGLTYEVVALMQTEMRIRCDDFFLSNVLIVDWINYNLGVFSKFTPTVILQLFDILMSLKARVEFIHFLNLPSSLNQIRMMLNPLMPEKIAKRIKSHKNYESLHQCIPKECLPSDFGGTLSSLEDLQDDWCKKIESHETDFKKLLSAKWHDPESKREKHSEHQDGVAGSFRKLCID